MQDPTLSLGDGAYKVFINALSKEKDMSDDMRAFLDYLCYHEAKSDLTRDIAASITQAKAYRPWRSEYMKLDDIIKMEKRDSYREGHADGLSVGEDNMARLNLYLLEHGRTDDLLRASTDEDYRAAVFAEMESAISDEDKLQ